ncbi:thioredoxin-dependent thiol peroxidase [Fluviicola chungangensis]|uniref:thioredoxin-dependent peroxiredoxin n=1 Tax=Fluviicola chungangensis TaxID=2597671 RepID=A0A556MJ97_9FLAO|nr:thioredoxin-dependent thiol peroxidase [Fluviicola chungangensis]TSJ39987.1 thioredoxin-dependent thiol peroxidase [Fluviicola chungangensis]
MTGLKVGDRMPDFQGKDQNGKEISNRDFANKKLVIYFYPKDNTPACTNQACSLRDSYQALQQKGYAILGVSMDTEKMHTRFIEKFSLPFSLIADTERKMIDAFKVWGLKKFMGREYDGIHRTTFVINEKGIITHIIEKPKTKIHGEELLNLD